MLCFVVVLLLNLAWTHVWLTVASSLRDGDLVDACDQSQLKELIAAHRTLSWVCRGASVPFIDDAPWETWALDDTETFTALSFKAIKPHSLPKAEGIIWSVKEEFHQSSDHLQYSNGRDWISKFVRRNMAVAIEGLNRLRSIKEYGLSQTLFRELGFSGGIDLYVSHVGKKPVGSYGWHCDTVDALIYVLHGQKRVRVAGYTIGSEVVIDQVIGTGSVVYVPGGRFHHLLSLNTNESSSASDWVKVVSFGLVNANTDLLGERVDLMRESLLNRQFKWSKGPPELLPKLLESSIVYSDFNVLDLFGKGPLHRRAERGEAVWVQILLHQGAEVNLRTTDSHLRTSLGLALCCAPEESVREVVMVLLQFHARVDNVETRSSGPVGARLLALERNLVDIADLLTRDVEL